LDHEPRKASDVLLELEKKLDVALGIIRTQDLNIKILSNKLNSVLEVLQKQGEKPQFSVEAVHTTKIPQHTFPFPENSELGLEKQVAISADFNLPVEQEPKGFRRTSRPETFEGDNAYRAQAPKLPTQVPKAPPGRSAQDVSDIIVPSQPKPKAEPFKQAQQKSIHNAQNTVQNAIPVQQRVVNAFGKSMYLADVEIIDLDSMQQAFKTRTNGTGKWMASLAVGNYRVIIKRLESATSERLEVTQDIQVDGTQSPLELQTIIIKS
jgi:hypothetical protein